MIGRNRWNRALTFVRRTELPAELEELIRESNAGRKRTLTVEVLLAGMLLTFDEKRGLTLTEVHATLTKELPLDVLQQHELEGLTLRQVRYLWALITNAHESSKAYAKDLDPVERAVREDRFQEFLDRFVGETSRYLEPTGRYAMDATAIDSAARPGRRLRRKDKSKKRKTTSFDQDARHGYRTETVANRSNFLFGYQAEAAARIGKVGDNEPLLIERFTLVKGNDPSARHALGIIDRLADDGIRVVEVIADRAYSNAKVANWARPLSERGIRQVQSIHPSNRGARPHADGYVMVDGWPYHPSIPAHLINIPRPAIMTLGKAPAKHKKAKYADWKRRRDAIRAFEALVAEREAYRYRRTRKNNKTRPHEGSEVYRCPGQVGALRCQGCATVNPTLAHLPNTVPYAPLPASGVIPKACQQGTISIPWTVQEKLRQEHPWGTPAWEKSFGRRTRVEGAFGGLKPFSGSNIQRGWTRQVGRVKTGMLLAIATAAYNLRTLIRWAKRTGNTADPLTQMDDRVGRFVELPLPDLDGPDAPPGTDPPKAA